MVFSPLHVFWFVCAIGSGLISKNLGVEIINTGTDFYQELEGAATKPKKEVFDLAIKGHQKLIEDNLLTNKNILSIIDMSLPSTKKRFWTINIGERRIISHSLVAHGKNTGDNTATPFSNRSGSHQTSLGFYATGQTYYGKHGYSLYLDGLEKGINNLARERSIVIHGASYVSAEFINKYGRLGRSFGCPALPKEESKAIIDLIKDGSCLFIYFPKEAYFEQSIFFN